MIDVLIILVLLVVNGLFAMYEMALVSSSKVRLETMAAAGNGNARRVLAQVAEPEKILSAIQVGITLIGIISGAFGGVALTDDFRPVVEAVSWLKPYAASVSMIVVVGSITYLSLIVGELVPKSLALSNPERVVVSLAPLMVVVTKIAFPFVWLLSISTRLVNKMLGIKKSEDRAMNEEELKFILHESSQQGVIDAGEGQMLREVFRFADKRADEIMTHRRQVVAFEIKASRDEVLNAVRTARFSKYPVYSGTLDRVVGVVSVKDMVMAEVESFSLAALIHPPIYVPESMEARRIVDIFKERQAKFAIVVSEYGGTEGIVTLHDLTEAVFGDIPQANESPVDQIVKRVDGSWLVDGQMTIDDFMDAMGIVIYSDLEAESFNTLGGMAMSVLGHMPAEGERFTYRDLTFEIVDMDAARVDKLLVTNN